MQVVFYHRWLQVTMAALVRKMLPPPVSIALRHRTCHLFGVVQYAPGGLAHLQTMSMSHALASIEKIHSPHKMEMLKGLCRAF